MSEEYKITNMLVTDEDIENIDNNWQSIIDEYLKMYVREKDQVIAQYLMRKQDKEIERLKKEILQMRKLYFEIKDRNNKAVDRIKGSLYIRDMIEEDEDKKEYDEFVRDLLKDLGAWNE